MTTPKNILFALSLAVIVALGGYFALNVNWDKLSAVSEEQAVSQEPAAGEQAQEQAGGEAQAFHESGQTDSASVSIAIDVDKAAAPRTLGNADAPVTIIEFASLTCSHCGHFHKETFSKLKEAYIDTGKVRLVYTDFPLNSPAMDASMLARCLPEDKFFKFVSFLFETQEEWAYNENYRQILKQNAKLLGASDELVEACLASEDLKDRLLLTTQAATKKYNVEATPTFILNETEKVSGAQPFEVFKAKIDKLLENNKS